MICSGMTAKKLSGVATNISASMTLETMDQAAFMRYKQVFILNFELIEDGDDFSCYKGQ
jgi:hypothetical protein